MNFGEEETTWVDIQRAEREITFQLQSSLVKLRGLYSYRRSEGLNELLKLLSRLDEVDLTLFAASQTVRENSVLSIIFETILSPSSTSPLSAISVLEKQRALELTYGLLLLHIPSKRLLRELNGIKLLLSLATTSQVEIRVAAVEALGAALLDSRENQKEFLVAGGLKTFVKILKNRSGAWKLRTIVAEVLALFAGWYDERSTDDGGEIDYSGGTLSDVKKELVKLLGAKIVEELLQIPFQDMFVNDYRIPLSDAFLHYFDRQLSLL